MRVLPLGSARRRVAAGAVILAAVVVGYLGSTFVRVVSASNRDHSGTVDAIVVLGAAQYDGEPSPVLARRLDHAHQLYREGTADLVVTTGSSLEGDRFTEGYAGYEYLLRAGMPDEALLVITDGESTWEQLAATKRQLRALGRDTVVLVSDPYHSLRLIQIASEVGLQASVSPTDGGSSLRQLVRETAGVALGQLIGYRRVDNWFGDWG